MEGKGLTIYQQLVRHLQLGDAVVLTSTAFTSLKGNADRVSFAYDLLRENDLLPDLALDGKSNEKSEQFRQKGNEMFKKRNSKDALDFYTASVAVAVNGSKNLALAFANRSAVLFENGLYEECLLDIDQALKNSYPEDLKLKLLTRMRKSKDLLSTQVPITFSTPIPTIGKENQNPLIQCASDYIKIEHSTEHGRYISASKNIEPGTIIAIEKPHYQVIVDQFYTHCHHCLRICYNLVPCSRCTQTLYCDENCRNEALSYHQYECSILLSLRKMDMGNMEMLAFKIALLESEKYVFVNTSVLYENDEVYRSDRYYEIHNLVANTEKRTVSDLFNRAVTAAIIFHFIKNYTSFFEDKKDSSIHTFKELVLLHMQTGPCNFHEINVNKTSDVTFKQQEIGAGAYSFLSLFNHSCRPNVVRYSYGSIAVMTTLESIKEGEQCFDNYGYHHALMNKIERQANLKKQYLFDCSCMACENNYPLHSDLPLIKESDVGLSESDIKILFENNLEETKNVFKKIVKEIKEVEKSKPNKNLAELQEALKQCYFIFRSIKTPF